MRARLRRGGCGGAAAITAATHGGSTGTGGASIGSVFLHRQTRPLRASAGTTCA
jgi:hypothetical protein